jgi:hypothetical protein
VTTYAFDNADRLTSLAQNRAGTADDLTETFSFNPFGGKTIHWIVF